MKLKHKLPLISIVLLVLYFISLWVMTEKTILQFTIDYQHKIYLSKIERHTQNIEYDIQNGKRQLWRIGQKLNTGKLSWKESSHYFYDALEDSVFDKIGLVYKDKTYHITGRDQLGDLSHRTYLNEAFEGKTVVSEPLYSKSNNIYQIVIAVPISYNEEILGAVIGTIPMQFIGDIVDSLRIDGYGFGILIDSSGDVILNSEYDAIGYTNFYEHVGIDQFTSKSGFLRYHDGEQQRYAFFKQLDGLDFFAVSIIGESDLYKPITALFHKNLQIFIMILILACILTYFAIKNIFKPVSALIDAMIKAEDGDYMLQVPVEREDEVANIAIQFNKTIEKISFRDEELQALNEELIASFREINETNEKMLQLYFDTIKALVQAMEFKDTYTKGHSERVMEYSLRLGSKLNLTQEEMEILRHGSILHDIGKLGIPDEVLLKASTLNEEEYNIIKEHSRKGASFIENLEFLKESLPIIRNHHERFDGGGYPDQLKGDEIPLLVKIVTIADAYDAMTTRRAYKEPFTMDEAVIELRRNKGTQFDPFLVEKFIETIYNI